MKKESENLKRAKKAIDAIAHDFDKADKLCDLEKFGIHRELIWGAGRMALYMLNTDDYYALKKYTEEKHGFYF